MRSVVLVDFSTQILDVNVAHQRHDSRVRPSLSANVRDVLEAQLGPMGVSNE